MSKVTTFLHRRFQPNEPYGWSLTLGLAVSLLALQLFLVVYSGWRRQGALWEFDQRCANTMKEHAEAHPPLRSALRLITHAGGVPAMAALAVLSGALLWWRHQRLLAVGWIITAATGGLLNLGLKKTIDRPRPELRDAAITEMNESFPSGHSMGSVVGYGMLAYVAMLLLRRTSARLAVLFGLLLLVLLIGLSRLYLRAHWFSDVLGGFAIGMFWLTLGITTLEVLRLRKKPKPLVPVRALR